MSRLFISARRALPHAPAVAPMPPISHPVCPWDMAMDDDRHKQEPQDQEG